MRNKIILALAIVCCLLIFSCGPARKPYSPSTLGYKTLAGKKLQDLPKPKGKIYVAVYNFRDQSGQYKYHASVSSFSTAVTQGGTAMLIQALLDSGWFVVVEREGLNDLLTERKIIRAKLEDKTQKKDSLPVLYHAPLILEGGVVSYETNVSTGGFGAKYFGIGGFSEYRKDQVALYLRGIDVSSGEVILSVSTSKSIFSQQVDFSVFRYVAVDRLLEIETGLSTNEPPQMCVLEAIEKAVLSFIIEGVLSGRWQLNNPMDLHHPIIMDYIEEKGLDPEVVLTQKLQSGDSEKIQGETALPKPDEIEAEKNGFLEEVKKKSEDSP